MRSKSLSVKTASVWGCTTSSRLALSSPRSLRARYSYNFFIKCYYFWHVLTSRAPAVLLLTCSSVNLLSTTAGVDDWMLLSLGAGCFEFESEPRGPLSPRLPCLGGRASADWSNFGSSSSISRAPKRPPLRWREGLVVFGFGSSTLASVKIEMRYFRKQSRRFVLLFPDHWVPGRRSRCSFLLNPPILPALFSQPSWP